MAMTKKQKDAYFAEARKRGNVKTGEILSPGSIARGAFKVAAKVANTKAGVKATKAVAKKVQARAVKQNKKTVNKIADMQQKVKAEKIANNSVKIISAGSKPRTKTASELAELNKNVKKGKAYSSGSLKKSK